MSTRASERAVCYKKDLEIGSGLVRARCLLLPTAILPYATGPKKTHDLFSSLRRRRLVAPELTVIVSTRNVMVL